MRSFAPSVNPSFTPYVMLRGSPTNISLGGNTSAAVSTAVKNLVASEVTTVVKAGNDNGDACGNFPASKHGVTIEMASRKILAMDRITKCVPVILAIV